MKRIYIAAVVVCAMSCSASGRAIELSAPKGSPLDADNSIGRAFKNRASHIQVEGEGLVIRLLADDVAGDRHQRFVVRLASGQTVLIAHNINVAPRVVELRKGDSLRFCGEYVWNEKGGLVHWMHRDPKERHPAGWLKHNGRTYQ